MCMSARQPREPVARVTLPHLVSFHSVANNIYEQFSRTIIAVFKKIKFGDYFLIANKKLTQAGNVIYSCSYLFIFTTY